MDKKYSILIICIFGLPNHIERFIRNLKQTNPSVSITLFSDREKYIYPEELWNHVDGYIQKQRYTGWPHRLWRFRRWFDMMAFISQVKQLSKSHYYDIVNIHYPQYFLCYVMRFLKKMTKTIIVSPWGSDILRVENKQKKKLSRVLKNAHYITVASTGLFNKVLRQEMKIPKEKFHPLGWGSETIDYINEHLGEISTEQAKDLLGLNGKYLITCGYNAFKAQRHEIIINAINERRKDLPDNMTLLFPVTYGFSYGTIKQEYVDTLKAICANMNLPVVFYEKYLSVSELFLLRRATDLFIHIQPTDGGNTSLQEYVLCGKKVIHGAWISYAKLEQYKPLFYYPVNDLNDLGDVIVKAVNSEPIKTPVEVLESIRKRGWQSKMKQWNDFFVSCCNS